MTTRDKHIAQKKKEIEKIHRRQFRLIVRAAKIAGAPYKRQSTLTKRMIKVVAITKQVRMLEMQKHMIIAQPIPRPIPSFVPGGVVHAGSAIVGEGGKEIIITKTGNIEIK